MYTRVTTYQADPARLNELTAKLPQIKAKLGKMDGLVDWYASWRADGHGVIFSVFEDQASADASLSQVRELWAGLAGLLKAPPRAEGFENVETLDD